MRAAANGLGDSTHAAAALRLGLPVPMRNACRLAFSLAGVAALSQLAMAAAAEPTGAALALGLGGGPHARVTALALAFVLFHASSELLLVMAKAELAKALARGKAVAAVGTGATVEMAQLVPACTPRAPFSLAFVLTFLASWLQQFALEQLTLGADVVRKVRYFALAYAILILVPWGIVGCGFACHEMRATAWRPDRPEDGAADGGDSTEKEKRGDAQRSAVMR